MKVTNAVYCLVFSGSFEIVVRLHPSDFVTPQALLSLRAHRPTLPSPDGMPVIVYIPCRHQQVKSDIKRFDRKELIPPIENTNEFRLTKSMKEIQITSNRTAERADLPRTTGPK